MTHRSPFIFVHSRENPGVKAWRRLAQDSHAYRRQGLLWLEGEHLCSMALQAGWQVEIVVVSATRAAGSDMRPWLPAAGVKQAVQLDDSLFAHVSGLESPAGLAYVVRWPGLQGVLAGEATVVLDRLQDAGNVGAILRCAAAFGFRQVVALQGTAGLWSPKVLRAGMGAHFALHLVELAGLDQVRQLGVPLLLTSSHGGDWLHQAQLPWPCAWLMGHEGQGVAAELTALPHQAIRIIQPGGQESLNVATAAAICLHASAVQAR